MRHPYRTTGLVVAAVVLLTGCSVNYRFQLLLTVRNADDKTPIEGVTGVLDLAHDDQNKSQLDHGHLIGPTGPDGKLTTVIQIGGNRDFYRHWFVKLQLKGFEPLVIDVRPNPVPESKDGTPVPVVVEVKLLPKQP